jgi:hypothetical protein
MPDKREKRSRDTKPSPMPDLLEMAGDHLPYEVHMVYLTAVSLSQPHTDGPTHDALVESCALHTRNAVFFFDAPERVDADDVIAEDYFASGADWRRVRDRVAPDPALFAQIRRQAAKQIAHLTYDRLNIKGRADKVWRFGDIWNLLSSLRDAWLAEVDVSYRNAWHAKVRSLDAVAQSGRIRS